MNTRTFGFSSLVISFVVLAACSSTAQSPSSAPTSTASASIVTPSSSVASSAPTSSTTTAMPRAVLAPGDRKVFEGVLVDHPYFRSTTADTVGLDAWFVAADSATGLRQSSAWLGQATVFRDGRFRLEFTVPSVIADRSIKFGTAVARATTAGEYRVEGVPGVSLVVQVTRDAAPLAFAAARPAPVDPSRQVLGDNDLAGVAFGTRDDDAEARLVARFGPSTGRKDWSDGCSGQYRSVWWGALVVEFRRDRPDGDGRLAAYRYGAPDWFFAGADREVASVAGLGTRDGIVLGSTVAQLRGVSDRGEFHTDYEGFVAARWNVPGKEIVATLDRDFLVADAIVKRISAPRDAALTVC